MIWSSLLIPFLIAMKPNKSLARRVFSTFPNRVYAIKPSTTKAFLGLNHPFFWASNDVVFGEVEALHKSVKKNESLPSAQSTNVKPVSRATLASFRLVNRNVHHVSRGGFAESHCRWLPQATDEWANGTGGQRAVKLEVRERMMIIGNYRKSLEIKGLKEIR